MVNPNLIGLGRREKFYCLNSLSAVPLILIGESIIVEMRNETSVAGRLINTDGFMNLTLENCVFIDQKGLQYPFDEFMIPERNLRQILIPDHINISNALKNYFTNASQKIKRNVKPTGKTFKQLRAIRRHNQILEEISKTKTQDKKD